MFFYGKKVLKVYQILVHLYIFWHDDPQREIGHLFLSFIEKGKHVSYIRFSSIVKHFFCRKSKGPLTNVTGVTLVEYFRTFGPILTSRYKVNFWDTWLLKFDNFWGPFSDAWFLMHEHGDLKCHASKSFVTLKVSSFLGTHYSKKSHFVQNFNFSLPNITF